MKIINASKVNKLNSQITCTSYYDFLTQKRQCLKALNCDPPRKTEIGDQFGSAMESAKYYEVDDKAAEWYLGTRASSVKKCSSTSQVPIRQRNLMATSHSVPGQRVSPEFLGLLQQHHARMGEHLLHNCRRPRINSSYYKYNAKGKRRHMRPGIDTAAPLEFPYHMEKDGLEYRKRLLRGQEIVIGPPAPLRSEEKPNSHGRYPFSPRTKRNKKRHAMKKCNQNNNINAKALKFLKVDNLEFPSTTEEDRDCSCNTYQKKRSPKDLNNNDNLQESMETKTDNHRLHTCNPSVLKPPHTSSPSVPKPPHLNETSQLINSTDQSTMCTCPSGKEAIPTIPTDKPKKNLLIKYVNTAFFKAMQGWRGAFPRNDSSRHSRYSQTPSDGNNKMEKFPTCRKIALESSGCKKHSVEGILSKRPCSKEPAFNSDFCQKKKVRIAISKCSTSVPDQKGSRLAKRDDNIPKIRGHCPDNSVKPLPCKVSPCTRSVAQPSCDHHLETNQSRKVSPDNTRICWKILNACPRSEAKPRVTRTEYKHSGICKKNKIRISVCKFPAERKQTKTNPCGSKKKPGIKEPGQKKESRLSEKEDERLRFLCPHLKTKRPVNPPYCRKVEKPRHGYHNCNKQRIPVKPSARKCGTCCPRYSTESEGSPKVHRSGERWLCKPIPIRCDPKTKKCFHIPHSSGNEITDFRRWLCPKSNSGRRKIYTKTRRTPRKGCRAIRKCHHSDTCSSCEQCPGKVRQQCSVKFQRTVWPTKPIPIRCDPKTKKCFHVSHSSGNEKTDLIRWIYPMPNSERRKIYTKTRRTPRKCCRATGKCHQSDTSLSCEQCPDKVRQQCACCAQREQGKRHRAKCCWERDESSGIPKKCNRFQEVQSPSALRGHKNYQQCCPHRKRWHCKPTCQENGEEFFPWSCEQSSCAPTDCRQLKRYCGSKRMRGGFDFGEEDDFSPGQNRDFPHSFSTSPSSDSDNYHQVKYTKPRKWSMHAFSFH